MVARPKLKEVGLQHRPSAWSLFMADMRREGVDPKQRRRLKKKTPVRGRREYQHRWFLVWKAS